MTWEELIDGDVPAEPAGSRRMAASPAPLSVDSDGSAPVELSDSLAALLYRPDRDRAAVPGAAPPTRRTRWRRLLARQALVEKGLSGYGNAPPDRADRTTDRDPDSPRSSLDLDQPKSLTSWDGLGTEGDPDVDADADISLEPPSPTPRSWRSVSSRSFHKRIDEPPRALAAIGRQVCMNDISHLVDAANSPCISYDRQIFDPASKLWRYVEADVPSLSSKWELGPASLGSPVTTRSTPCSVSATPSLPTPAAMHAAARRRGPAPPPVGAARRLGLRSAWPPSLARRIPSSYSEDGALLPRTHSNLSARRYRSSLDSFAR